ncbi:MAG: hypothetical protein CVU39_25515 [Chloroflexi bacterium HGW-Chloroflexi-10]|nr:MAG: hypothetical protein CVU39_25515 [Chloroflexi bacterium HGW-Chloroflexi-10]
MRLFTKRFTKYTISTLLLIAFFSACTPLDDYLLKAMVTESQVTPVVVYDPDRSPPATLPPVSTSTALPVEELRATLTPIATFTPKVTPPIIGVITFPENFNPLTGLEVANPEVLNRRPLIVKIANYPRFGRPHAGLSKADIVFDYYIGYGENRLAALYYGEDVEQVGPMRSGRWIDGELGRLYQAVVFYRNVDPEVNKGIEEKLGDRGIWYAECPPICDVGSFSVASSFGNTFDMETYLVEQGINNDQQNLSGMVFDPRIPENAPLALQVGIQFGVEDRAEWRYDPVSGSYLRWIEASASQPENVIPLVDRNSGAQLAFANVIVIIAEYTEVTPALHEIDLWGNSNGQPAYFFRDGVVVEGSWRVADTDRPIQFNDQYGRSMGLKPGNSWIVILDSNSTLVIDPAGQWEIQFQLD